MLPHKPSTGAALFGIFLTLPTHGFAQGAAVSLGETELVPSLQLTYLSSDNLLRTEEDPIEGSVVSVQPRLDWTADRRLLTLNASYAGDYTTTAESAADYTDHAVEFSAAAEFTSRNRSDFSLQFIRDHIDVGVGLLANSNSVDEVAEFSQANLELGHTFGAANAKGNVRGTFKVQSRNYSNLPTFTTGYDYNLIEGAGEFSYRASADTRLLVGIRAAQIDFSSDARDRDEVGVYTGLQFSATGKLRGAIRLGATQASYPSINRDPSTDLTITGALDYLISDISNIKLAVRREVDNAQGVVSDLSTSPVETTLGASWSRQWTSRISSKVGIEAEYIDASCPNVSMQTTTPSLELSYAFRRWISAGAQAAIETRGADNCIDDPNSNFVEDYERQSVGVFIRATL